MVKVTRGAGFRACLRPGVYLPSGEKAAPRAAFASMPFEVQHGSFGHELLGKLRDNAI
jgi:hypothetical protein